MFFTQALGVALVVAAMLALTRRGGTALAGIATAGITAPTLVLLAVHQGPVFALYAALGTLLSTPLCAGATTLALRWLRSHAAATTAPPPGHASLWAALWAALWAVLAGLMSAAVCAGAHDLGALGSGIVGGLPVVAAFTTLGTRWHSGSAAAARYVLAYRSGLWLRGVMTVVFVAAVLPLGAAWAMALALAASGMAAMALATARRLPCPP